MRELGRDGEDEAEGEDKAASRKNHGSVEFSMMILETAVDGSIAQDHRGEMQNPPQRRKVAKERKEDEASQYSFGRP